MNAVETPEAERQSEADREMLEHRLASGDTPDRAMARSAAFRQAYKDYPNRWVAYREIWDGDRLVQPFVVAHGSRVGEVDEKLKLLPIELTEFARIRYLGPPLRCPIVHRLSRSV